MKCTITFGRGSATITTRTTKCADPTEIGTTIIKLNDNGMTIEREWFFDYRYWVSAYGVRKSLTQDEFDALLRKYKLDIDCIEDAIMNKYHSLPSDPMGNLSWYE